METAQQHQTQRVLQCMEIWGGNQAMDTSITTPGLDLWVYSRPHEDTVNGGDVQYVSLCGGGVITRFILADVSGHGASAAEMARSLRDLMRRNINRKNHGRLVSALNSQFADVARQRRFATAIVATYLAKGDRLTISNAGHPRPLWYRASAGEWTPLIVPEDDSDARASNLPLGIDGETPFDHVQVALGRGDLVLFYTDALTEAADASGRLLGERGLLEMVHCLDTKDPAGMPPALVKRLNDYRAGKPADDDLSVMLLHHNASHPRPLTFLQSLDVYAKVLHLKRV